MKRKIITKVPVALVVLALAGCSGGEGRTPESSGPATGAVTTQEAATGEKTPSNPGKGIISSTSMASCDKGEGEVAATGKVTRPENAEGTIKIGVSWVDSKTSSVLAQASQTIEDAETGKPTDWAVKTTLGKYSTEITCVLSATVLPRE